MSSSRGIPYYYHRATGCTQWERPATAAEHVHVYHLLVKHCHSRRPASWREANITRTPEEALQIITGYEAEIRAATDPLARLKELARQYSDCSSAREGGDLGEFGRGKMQPAFEQAAFALAPGQLSSPVTSDSGVHLIYRVK